MNSPFSPIPLLWLPPVDSELYTLLAEAHRLTEEAPGILERIDLDLDLHGKRKKAARLQDAEWREARTRELPAVGWEPAAKPAETLVLQTGRRRTSAYVVLMFLVGRGYYGGFKTAQATTLLSESITFAVFLQNLGLNMPGQSTVSELVNAVSAETREVILTAQVRAAMGEGLDDMKTMLQDSTAIEANTQWPKESQLMVDLLSRVLRRGDRLDRFGLPKIEGCRAKKWLGQMVSLHKQISMGMGKADSRRQRKKLYRDLLRIATKMHVLLAPQVELAGKALGSLDMLPSRRDAARELLRWLRADLQSLQSVMKNCDARVLHDCKVPADEKVLSVSDQDAAFIVKGGHDTVVGYKPQLARSAKGFILGLLLPAGNAADSDQLVPMFNQVIERTEAIPTEVSVDDGYSSRAGRDELMNRGVKVVSISGAKGKHITPQEEWDSLEYAQARDGRSAIESLMFTIKHGFDFGRVARRGLENARAELLEKAIAYNLLRAASLRRRATKADELSEAA